VHFIEQFAVNFCSSACRVLLRMTTTSGWGIKLVSGFSSWEPSFIFDWENLWLKQAIEQPDTRLSLATVFFITSSTPSADNSNLKSYHQLHSNLWFVSSKVHAGQWQTPFTMAGFWNPSHDRRAWSHETTRKTRATYPLQTNGSHKATPRGTWPEPWGLIATRIFDRSIVR
jgi:hypothetical protein